MLERTFAAERLVHEGKGQERRSTQGVLDAEAQEKAPCCSAKGPHITYQNGCPVVVDYQSQRFTGTDHNRTPAYLKAVNSGRRVRFADEVCGSLGTELDRTTYQDSCRLPDYAPPSIQTKVRAALPGPGLSTAPGSCLCMRYHAPEPSDGSRASPTACAPHGCFGASRRRRRRCLDLVSAHARPVPGPSRYLAFRTPEG